MLPRFRKHVIEQQHRHVATDAIATLGYREEQVGHRGAGGRAAIIELDAIGPGREERIFAVRQPTSAEAGRLREALGRLAINLHE